MSRARLIFIGLVLAIIGAFGASLLFGQLAARATPSAVGRMASNEQKFTIKAVDGVRIAASFFPAANDDSPVILLLHGNGSSRTQYTRHVVWLNSAGFSAMAIDFRGHGESGGAHKSFGLLESRDAEAALHWIRQYHPKARVGVIGMSLGGAAALLGKAGPLDVDAMVLQAVFPDIDHAIRNRIASKANRPLAAILTPMLTYQSYFRFGVAPEHISPIRSARLYRGPVLVVGGEKDSYTPVNETRALANAFPSRASLWIMPGLEHAQINGGDDPVYSAKVIAFFSQHLKTGRAAGVRH